MLLSEITFDRSQQPLMVTSLRTYVVRAVGQALSVMVTLSTVIGPVEPDIEIEARSACTAPVFPLTFTVARSAVIAPVLPCTVTEPRSTLALAMFPTALTEVFTAEIVFCAVTELFPFAPL